MKTLLLAAIAGVLLFSGSAAVSWYLMNQQQLANPEADQETVEPLDSESENVPPVKDTEKTEEMPVGIRPDMPITLDAVMQLSKSVRLKEQQLKAEDERLRKERDGIQMMFTDLQLARDQMDAFATQIESKLRSLREYVEQAKIETAKLEAQESAVNADSENSRSIAEIVAPELMNQAEMAIKIMAKMDSETAAGLVKQWVNEGKLKLAGLVIGGLEPRQGTKILSELSGSEPELASQLLEAASKHQ